MLTYEELITDLGYDINEPSSGNGLQVTDDVPTWLYNSNYLYWTCSQLDDSLSDVWCVYASGSLGSFSVGIDATGMVRPVIKISKTTLGDEDESTLDDDSDKQVMSETDKGINNDKETNESNIIVKVANTYMSSSITIIIVGFITASVSILIIYKLSNKKR